MKRSHSHLSVLLALLALLPGHLPAAERATNDPALVGEPATLAITPALRRHLVIIGRVSSGVYQAGVLVGKDGYILTAALSPLDADVDSPYLVMLPDGRRVVPEITREDKETGLVLLKSPEIPAGIEPAPIAAPGDAEWFLGGEWSPAPGPGEIPRIHLGRVIRRLNGADDPMVLDMSLRAPGSPIFDLAGRVVAIARKTAPDRLACNCAPVACLLASWAEVAAAITTANPPPAPPALKVTDTDKKGITLRTKQPSPPWSGPLPAVTVLQGERPVALGTILSADGLVLTKASELGDAPACQFHGQTWPAALLAVDEETDLALLRIDATGLPCVHWHDTVPAPGAWLYTGSFSKDQEGPPDFSCGLLSHRMALPRAHATLDQPEYITGLGIVLEQAQSSLVVGALLEGEHDGGLRRGDILKTLDGQAITGRADLTAVLATRRAGEHAELGLLRDGKAATVSVTLAAALPIQPPPGVNGDALANLASMRRSGFPDVLCHDCILDAPHCGGPVVDSQGHVVGLNIARTDRGSSLALTVPAIQAACKRLLSQTEPF